MIGTNRHVGVKALLAGCAIAVFTAGTTMTFSDAWNEQT